MNSSKDIQGNANISRNANVGSHANVNGDVVVGHNLFVKGWVDAPNIKGACKGLYASEEALKAAYPRPMPGWFALVGDTLPAAVWRADRAGDTGTLGEALTSFGPQSVTGGVDWTATGETGGQFSLWLDRLEGDVRDLRDEVRDLEELLGELDGLLAEGLLLGETIEFTSTGTAAAMKFNVMKRDGSTTSYSKAIPIASAEKAGMMSAADRMELSGAVGAIGAINERIAVLEANTGKLREDVEQEIQGRLLADAALSRRITEEAAERLGADDAQQVLIDRLRKDFDALVGDNASEAIDNFTEVLAFLDGLKDTDKLSAKLADLSGTDAKQAEEILELQEAVWPLTVELTATPLLIKAGAATNVHLAWKAERRGKDVTGEAEVILDGEATAGNTKEMSLTLGHGATRKFTLTATFERLTESAEATVRGSHPSYFGSVAGDWEGSEGNIKGLAEMLAGSRSLTRSGIAIDDGKIALAYPMDFGGLTSVRDGNGYEVLASYTRSEVSVNGIAYYLYLLTVPVTASGVTQIFR